VTTTGLTRNFSIVDDRPNRAAGNPGGSSRIGQPPAAERPMMPRFSCPRPDARSLRRTLSLVASVALIAACNDSSGPRTGKLSLTIGGLPTGVAAQVTVTGANGFSKVLTASDIVANLKPGDYSVVASAVRDGPTRYSALTDSLSVTITKSNTPVEASVSYAVSSGILTVQIAGTPTGATAAVRVTGPNGFTQTIAETNTFRGIDPGIYSIFSPSIASNQQQFAATPTTQQIQVFAGLNETRVSVSYAQITGNLTFNVTGLPAGTTADVSVSGPASTYIVGSTSDLIGVRSGQYTVTAKSVAAGGVVYSPNFGTQTITLSPAATVVVPVTYTRTDGPLNLTIDAVTLTQSIQTYDQKVPLVTGKDAFIRVFAKANQTNSASVQVRVRVYAGDQLMNTMTLVNVTGVPLLPDQSSLTSSWNGIILAQYVKPGLKILADVDPTNAVTEASETDNSFPVSGTPGAIDVRTVEPLKLMFVPVVQRYDQTLVGNISDANKEQFLGDIRRMLPILDIDAQIHAPYTTADSLELTSNDGNNEWLRVLSEMNALRTAESGVRHYFGVVKVSYNSGVAGYGYVPGRAVVGWDYIPSGRNVAAHELTHNFGRFHAPCGGAGGPDPNYPYVGGTIGVYGMDMTTTTLRLPSSFDLMGYCSNPWISDYNFVGAMDWRAQNPTPDVTTAGLTSDASAKPSLLVWGRVERGQLVLEPAFSIVTRPNVPREAGPYRVEGIARNGRTLFSYAFAGERPADVEDASARQFAFAIPMDEATQSELASIRLTGAGAAATTMQTSLAPGGIAAAVNVVDARSVSANTVRVQWNATGARMAMIRDRRTGQILSFARGGNAQVRTQSTDLDVILSDGVRSVARQIRVAK
jgi:hypothetical protein